eukprot:TRINITY_DN103591_c0_g1_i1.p1 TRINITY_DN103591_c0_g1~~TRINITY_DN103591_c0_g1_i1.p1  ORF type:complete len:144 (-),score=4.49 TRINITY_DN103591_c0_g1_i1:41-472(-)
MRERGISRELQNNGAMLSGFASPFPLYCSPIPEHPPPHTPLPLPNTPHGAMFVAGPPAVVGRFGRCVYTCARDVKQTKQPETGGFPALRLRFSFLFVPPPPRTPCGRRALHLVWPSLEHMEAHQCDAAKNTRPRPREKGGEQF